MLATEAVRFCLLLLLECSLHVLLMFLHLSRLMYGGLFRRDDLVLDVLVVVGPPARRAQAVHVILNIIIAELTDLRLLVSTVARDRSGLRGDANLIATRTRLETLVGEVELLDAERAGLFLVIVEYERVLLYAF